MKRTVLLSELNKAVDVAYDKFNDLKDGIVDQRISDADSSKFGIAVCLADGTIVTKGDVDVAAPIGGVLRLPLASLLFSEDSVKDFMEKIPCGCGCGCKSKASKPHIGVSACGVRAVSALQPVGDFDSKWNFIENRMIDMMGTAPVLDDALYRKLKSSVITDENVNAFANDGFVLYDDAAKSIDLYLRGESMKASALQLAVMGATVISGGINPVSGKVVFEGAVSPKLTAMMAVKGPHKSAKKWLIMTGLPALSGFGGAIVGVIPGVMSIAAYSPRVNDYGVTVRGARALADIMNSLGINAFSNSCVCLEK